jgi:hypothetical protein
MLLGQKEISCEAPRGKFISSDPYSCALLSVLNVEIDINLNGDNGRGGYSTKPDIILTITVSTNVDSSPTTAVIPSNHVTTKLGDSAAEGSGVRPSIRLNHESRQPMAVVASISFIPDA